MFLRFLSIYFLFTVTGKVSCSSDLHCSEGSYCSSKKVCVEFDSEYCDTNACGLGDAGQCVATCVNDLTHSGVD